jgi:hypothetical protein
LERVETTWGWIKKTRILLTCFVTAWQVRTFEILVKADH